LFVDLKSAVSADADLAGFYSARGYRPLWISNTGLRPEADRLLLFLQTAELDGLDPSRYLSPELAAALAEARTGAPTALLRAEALLTRAFASYAFDMRRPRRTDMIYVDPAAAPAVPTSRELLDEAASAASLDAYLQNVGWMHPLYGQLRAALSGDSGQGFGSSEQQLLRVNLERARALPANPGRRYILVDAAAARLYLYENGEVRDTMKVVVGKETHQTPMMGGVVRYAILNPYWNIPPDLVRVRIAPNAVKEGPGYLRAQRYEVLSSWDDGAEIIDAAAIDWEAVADGAQEVRVRQLPGGTNAMGKMKFMFPNHLGIYLHDTPERELLDETSRQFSSGCVRLEDAPRLARWIFGEAPSAASKDPEQKIDVPDPVPVYLTYLTAAPENGRIAFRPDVYDRDRPQLASLASQSVGGF
jgi:murein L,D-transpeptidase YcbB/YkuD